jgi:hypothetical protein
MQSMAMQLVQPSQQQFLLRRLQISLAAVCGDATWGDATHCNLGRCNPWRCNLIGHPSSNFSSFGSNIVSSGLWRCNLFNHRSSNFSFFGSKSKVGISTSFRFCLCCGRRFMLSQPSQQVALSCSPVQTRIETFNPVETAGDPCCRSPRFIVKLERHILQRTNLDTKNALKHSIIWSVAALATRSNQCTKCRNGGRFLSLRN